MSRSSGGPAETTPKHDGYAPVVQVNLLGPIEIEADDGHSILLSAAKERSLVAALALAGGATMSTDSLISALWGEQPPTAARKTLQTYVWNLRRAVGTEHVVTEPAGYRLCISRADVDVHQFRALVRQGDAALTEGRFEEARDALRAAMTLWRGELLNGVAPHTGLAAEATRLEQECLAALEARIAADLACGHLEELVGELEFLVQQHPFRERLWGHLMVALYRSGRQADALATYQRVRKMLLDELGLEPGGELRRIETAVLRHELVAPSTTGYGARAADDPVRPSPVRYARAADGISVAYQSAGRGPIAILAIPGYIHHLDIWWNAPTDGLVRALTEIGRLTIFDKRGIGLSDRPEVLDVDAWTLDALAVLDAIGAARAVVLGISAGALTAIQLAACWPERVSALVLFDGTARQLVADDYPSGHDPAIVDAYATRLEAGWGTGVELASAAPSLALDPIVHAYWARYQRLSASPSSAMRFLRATTQADVRHLLPQIHVPTLVTHAEHDLLVPLAQGRYVADQIAGAEFVSFDSDIHLICVSDVLDELAVAMTSFLARTMAHTTI
jgi:DNA-binding SARP family transcriptional activator/pimeloyl-ACP methyl ester carboxylesterase